MGIKHNYVSAIPDVNDPTKVRPSNWNADHVIDGDVDFQGNDILNCGNLASGGASAFTDLTDVPSSYAGANNKVVAVKNDSSGLEFITPTLSAAGDNFIEVVTPLQYGSFGSGDHLITAQDVIDNPQWIGPAAPGGTTWPVGTQWDTVATQEAIYAAFASASTPGSVVWNIYSGNTNRRLYIPAGNYRINQQLITSMEGFHMEWETREAASWNWYGGTTITGDIVSGVNGITNISAADIAKLYVGQTDGVKQYIFGDGIMPGTRVDALSATAITDAHYDALETASGRSFLITTSMFFCSAATYGIFKNPRMFAVNVIPRAHIFESSQPGATSMTALWVLDWDGFNAFSLRTQQLTIMDAFVQGANHADVGISISPSGGAAQGDTILWLNLVVLSCLHAGVEVGGANALSIQFINGDIQGCARWGIRCTSGSVYVNGMSFQPGTWSASSSPKFGQIGNAGYDVQLGAGTGQTCPSKIENVRSEGSSCTDGLSNFPTVANYTLAGSDQPAWFADYPHQLGTVIAPTSNNTLARSFILVDDGGFNGNWRHPTSVGVPVLPQTVTDSLASFTVNAYAGYTFFYRYGSQGFVEHYTGDIVSNTATDIVVGSLNHNFQPIFTTLYTITGQTGAAEPNWDSLVDGDQALIGTSQGVTTEEGNATIFWGSTAQPAIGDYVVIPACDTVGIYPWNDGGGVINSQLPAVYPLIDTVATKVANGSGFDITLTSKTPKRTLSNVMAYTGAVLADGTQGFKWMHIPFDAVKNVLSLQSCYFQGNGMLRTVGEITKSQTGGARSTTTLYRLGFEDYVTRSSNVENQKMSLGYGPLASKTVTAGGGGTATLHNSSGIVTSAALTTAAAANYTLTLTNDFIHADDLVYASVRLGTSTQGIAVVTHVTPASGSVVIVVRNIDPALAFNGTIKISFMVLQAQT